jgi:hypothetical protein
VPATRGLYIIDYDDNQLLHLEPSQPVVASVQVTPSGPQELMTGSREPLTALASDQFGNNLSGAVFDWTVSPSSLGTLSSATGAEVTFTAGVTSEQGSVCVGATEAGYGPDTVCVPTRVFGSPSVSLAANPATTEVGEASELTFSFSGGVAPLFWTLEENGSSVNLTGITDNEYTFAPHSTGSYTFYLNVTDSMGTTSGAIATVTVEPHLTVHLSSYPTATEVSKTVTLSYSIAGGVPPLLWTLTKNSSAANITGAVGGTYTYAPGGPGTYTFYLNATDVIGSLAQAIVVVTVSSALVATLIVGQTTVAVGTPVTIMDGTTGGVPPIRTTLKASCPGLSGDTLTPTLPGSCTIYLNATDSAGDTSNVSVSVSVGAGALMPYTLTFVESGLPASALAKYGWTVVFNGMMRHTTSSSINFTDVSNGSYPALVTGPSGYTSSKSGMVAVSGATTVDVTMARGTTYTLALTERGLPKGQSWCVEVNDFQQCTAKTSEKYLNLTPGRYNYSVVSPLTGQSITAKVGTTVYPLTGNLVVSKSETMALTFVYRYPVTFAETGLLSGTSWSVTVRGVKLTSTTSTIEFNETNGTYGYAIGAIAGLQSVTSPRPVRVGGGPETVTVNFTRRITFVETGLPRGTEWGVNVSGAIDYHKTATGTTITLSLGEGTYSLQFWSVHDYALVATGELAVTSTTGPAIPVSYDRAEVTFAEAGLERGTEWGVNVTGPVNISEETTATSISIPLEDGTYAVQFWTLDGYSLKAATEVNVTARVAQTVHVSYDQARVTFTESGLSSGTGWEVNVTCADPEECGTTNFTLASLGASVSVALEDGTYTIQYWSLEGYAITNSPPTTIVVVATTGQAIHITYRTT